MSIKPSPNELYQSALAYAQRGWHVFPCKRRDKVPLTEHGFKDATTAPETIRKWWERWPNANIGIATGASDLVVIDVDNKRGHRGTETWLDVLDQVGHNLAQTVRSETPNKGTHLYYRANGHKKKSVSGALGDGVDLKAIGGYVIGPPSVVTVDERDGLGEYAWDLGGSPDVLDIMPLPNALATLLPDHVSPSRETAPAARERPRAEDITTAERCLKRLSPARCDQYDSWVQIGMALSGLGNAGLALWDMWSQQSGKHKPGECAEKWRSFESDHGLTLGSLVHWATEDSARPTDIVFEGQPTTDMANGRRFAVLNRDKARYVKGWGWMIYTGRHWERNELAAMVLARAVVQRIYTEAGQLSSEKPRMARGRHAFASESLQRRKAMLESARSEPEMRAKTAEFDGDEWLLNVANGTIALRDGTLRPHASGDMLTKSAAASFDDDADLGHWKRHIEYFLPNPDVRRYVQRQLGRSLVGAHLADDLPIWYGEGANGRSTTARTLQRLLGDYCQQAPPNLLLASKHKRHPTELADLYGSRLVFSIEIDEGSRLAESLAKQLSGGDRVKGRFMHRDFFEFDPTWVITLVVNHKPTIRTGGHAIWRRLKLVPWAVTIPREQQRAQEEVVAELVEDGPAVLRWLLEGLADWQADHHWYPDEVLAATESYRTEQDPLKEWIDGCCFLGPEAWASAKELRASYEAWGAERGVGPRALVSGARWGKGLRARGCRPLPDRVAGKKTRGWLGIGLQSGTDGTDTPVTSLESCSREEYTEHAVPPVPVLGRGAMPLDDLVDDDGKPIPF